MYEIKSRIAPETIKIKVIKKETFPEADVDTEGVAVGDSSGMVGLGTGVKVGFGKDVGARVTFGLDVTVAAWTVGVGELETSVGAGVSVTVGSLVTEGAEVSVGVTS